jgi:acetolactate synthase-1/3 small subunit
MLRRRNFNIDSLQVGHSETPGISRMTFVVDGDERMVDQVIKQLRKVVDVTQIENITDKPSVTRELALVRVRTTPETRSEIVQMVNIYRGAIVDVTLESMVVQIVASEEKVDALIDLLDNFGIDEMVRTGKVALVRGTTERRRKRSTTVWRASANGMGHPEDRLATGGV